MVRGVNFDLDRLLPTHIKTLKENSTKLMGKSFLKTLIFMLLDNKQANNFEELAVDCLNKNCKWTFSGHSDILK